MDFWQQMKEIIGRWPVEYFWECPQVQHTFFLSDSGYTREIELPEIKRSTFSAQLLPVLKDPIQLPKHDVCSDNTIHQVHHLCKYFEWLGYIPDGPSVEFGGGCGAGAYVLNQLTKKEHTIVDFPEIHRIQKYYLSGLPDFSFVESPQGLSANILTAFWSLSEAPLDIRNQFLTIPTRHVVIIFSEKWEDIDNMAYFSNLMNNKRFNWALLPHHLSGNYYLFGVLADKTYAYPVYEGSNV